MGYSSDNKNYWLQRYHSRRAEALNILGGKCVICGTTVNLEIDHKNPSEKSFDIGKLWGVAKAKFYAELEKCQLLCTEHHLDKTLTNGDAGKFHARHGTYYMYRRNKCRCVECKSAEREQRKKW